MNKSARAPLSLANYAFRAVIRNDTQNIDETTLIDPLLAEFKILKEFEGRFIVRSIEFRMENYFCENRCVPRDRYTWFSMNKIESPDVGDDISISRDGAKIKIRGTFTNLLNLDLDWSDYMFPTMQGGHFHSNPDIYRSIYFENGMVKVLEWYNWHNAEGNFVCSPQIPEPEEAQSLWEIGNMQTLTIDTNGDLIWTFSQTHNYDANSRSYPPLLKTTWICKAAKLCSSHTLLCKNIYKN